MDIKRTGYEDEGWGEVVQDYVSCVCHCSWCRS